MLDGWRAVWKNEDTRRNGFWKRQRRQPLIANFYAVRRPTIRLGVNFKRRLKINLLHPDRVRYRKICYSQHRRGYPIDKNGDAIQFSGKRRAARLHDAGHAQSVHKYTGEAARFRQSRNK